MTDRREADRRYNASEKGRARGRAYNASPRGQVARAAWGAVRVREPESNGHALAPFDPATKTYQLVPKGDRDPGMLDAALKAAEKVLRSVVRTEHSIAATERIAAALPASTSVAESARIRASIRLDASLAGDNDIRQRLALLRGRYWNVVNHGQLVDEVTPAELLDFTAPESAIVARMAADRAARAEAHRIAEYPLRLRNAEELVANAEAACAEARAHLEVVRQEVPS